MPGSESSDSDCGIRFKTASTRNHSDAHSSSYDAKRSRNERDRDYHRRRKKSHHQDRKSKRSRSPRSPKRSSKSHHKESKSKRHQDEHKKMEKSNPLEHIKLDDKSNPSTYGPSLPPQLVQNSNTLGPQLPSKKESSTESSIKQTVDEPVKDLEQRTKIYGPQLPKNTVVHQQVESVDVKQSVGETEEICSDDDMIGPLPPGVESNYKVNTQLEIRALELKLKKNQTDVTDTKIREDWMLQLPDVKLIPELNGPRTFRPNAGPDFSDRSSWTDTPTDKIKKQSQTKNEKVDLKVVAAEHESEKRDKEQERIIKEHKKKHKRDETLLEIHRKEQSKKQKEMKTTERRPFNRETDLQLTRIDAAQKDAMIRKAMLLDDRFSAGKSKFL